MIVTLPEPYLSYDLSPEDAIAMRLYPIDRRQSPYWGARRTGLYASVDGSPATRQLWARAGRTAKHPMPRCSTVK
jgi:hypothetical protein